MNLKTKKIIIILLILMEFITINLTFKSLNNKPIILDEVKLKELKVDKNMFGIYVEKDNYANESDKYEEYNGDEWPTGYIINTSKSACMDVNGLLINNAVDYQKKSIVILTGKTAYCYIYFDKLIPDINIAVANYNGAHNTKTINCDTGETTSPITAYFNTKYQGVVFSNVKSAESNCTLTSENVDLSSSKTKLSDTITGLIASGNTSATSGDGLIVDETSETVTNNTSVTLTAGYRYEGTNPNNYIWFNNEMWRIIGLIPTCTSENCATKEDLVKIIRKDSIGSIAYDAKASDYTGAWGSNTLYHLLNEYYYGKKDNTNHATDEYCFGYQNTAKTKCDYRVNGISDSASDYYGNMIREVIWNTGASTNGATAKTVYGNEIKTQSVSGKIGLMSASDYGYASSTHADNLDSYNTASITLVNWLYTNNYERTITQYTTANSALHVFYSGDVKGTYAYTGYATRPVLYLKSLVYVISGDGSEANPYQIAM